MPLVVKRRIVAITLVIVCTFFVFLLVWPQPRFGEERFQQIREGMTEAEVISILGAPAGDYRPAIWKNPDWFVSPSDPSGFPLSERGRSPRQVDEMKRQEFAEWVQAGMPIPSPLHV
jgi:hypothetical protein